MSSELTNEVLIIDDDFSIRRPILTRYWKGFRHHWLTKWPDDFVKLLETNPNIKYLSLDHDLGNDSEVSRHINWLLYDDFDRFHAAVKDLEVVVHSMNPTGAESIYRKLHGIAKRVKVIPLNMMGR
jgi:hypothetical protein